MRSKDFVSVFLLQQLLVTASRSGKEKEMNRKDVKKLLIATVAMVIGGKIARDIMKARKQKEKLLCKPWTGDGSVPYLLLP